MTDNADRTEAIYAAHHGRHKADRNDVLRNPGVLFQLLAADAALVRALGKSGFRVGQTVLDVGGGGGGSLVPFMALGCPAATLTCLDIRDGSAEIAARFPGIAFHQCDAQKMPFADATYDVAVASNMFLQITDDGLAAAIGREMRRIVKPGGLIVVRDWALAHRGREEKAVTRARIQSIFDLPVAHTEYGAVLPPVGRFLSAYAPWAYFIVQKLLPAGRVYVLRP
jgi:ubiquinone/menaquinone biosynthesis C-methylase UbiE